jgi:DNA-directed RNA polymerase III subunit RPC1
MAGVINRLAKLYVRFLINKGFLLEVGNVFPINGLTAFKDRLVEITCKKCNKLIAIYKAGKLEKASRYNIKETLENSILGILSKVY